MTLYTLSVTLKDGNKKGCITQGSTPGDRAVSMDPLVDLTRDLTPSITDHVKHSVLFVNEEFWMITIDTGSERTSHLRSKCPGCGLKKDRP